MKTDDPMANHFATYDDFGAYNDSISMLPDIIITKRSNFD
jgi:hypothetical protein